VSLNLKLVWNRTKHKFVWHGAYRPHDHVARERKHKYT